MSLYAKKPRNYEAGYKNIKPQYAYSIKTERVKEKDFPYNGERLSCTQELHGFSRRLLDSDVEKMIIIYLDAQNTLTGIYPIIGTINQCTVFPREIIKHALLCGASSFIMVHNHPSGLVKPSSQDIAFTKKIQAIGKELDMELHDHAIIGGNSFYSFREEGII